MYRSSVSALGFGCRLVLCKCAVPSLPCHPCGTGLTTFHIWGFWDEASMSVDPEYGLCVSGECGT